YGILDFLVTAVQTCALPIFFDFFDRPAIVKAIEEALEHGDLRENAEYHAAKERQAELDARMRWCEYRIGRALVIDPATLQEKKVAFGATLTVLDLDADEELNYVIV